MESPDRSSPTALLDYVLAARDRRDLGALARASSTSIGRDTLNEHDARRAERDFLHRSQTERWRRFRSALGEETFALDIEECDPPEGDPAIEVIARFRIEVGGALGEDVLVFLRVDGQWYLQTSP